MPNLPEKFEDWTWPWQQGEVDEEKFAKLLFNRTKDLEKARERSTTLSAELDQKTKDLQASQDDLEDARASSGDAGKADAALTEENKTLKRQVRELERDKGKPSPQAQGEIDRLTVAIKLGLSLADSKRLVGNTLDEIEADARTFAEEHGIELGNEDGANGEQRSNENGEQGPPRRGVIRAGDLKIGSGQNGGPIAESTRKVLDELPPL